MNAFKTIVSAGVMMALLSAVHAEIRTYQPKEVEVESPQPSNTQQDDAYQKRMEGMWNQIQSQFGGGPARQMVTIYIHTEDYGKDMNEGLRRLLETLKKLPIPPNVQYYINDNGYREERPDVLLGMQDLGESFEFDIDRDDDVAQAFGLEPKSTLIYHDPTGAVRLYSLSYEVDKLERQLKRQMQEGNAP